MLSTRRTQKKNQIFIFQTFLICLNGGHFRGFFLFIYLLFVVIVVVGFRICAKAHRDTHIHTHTNTRTQTKEKPHLYLDRIHDVKKQKQIVLLSVLVFCFFLVLFLMRSVCVSML